MHNETHPGLLQSSRNSQLNSKDSLVEAFIRQRKRIHVRGAGASMHNRRLPVGPVHAHIAKRVDLAGVRVEPGPPGQRRVRAAPPAAKVPGARAAVEHVLVDATAVSRLQTRPEVVCGCGGERGNDHRPGELSEVGARGRVVGQKVPCDGGHGVEEGEERER